MRLVAEQVGELLLVVVGQDDAEAGAEVLLERQVDHDVEPVRRPAVRPARPVVGPPASSRWRSVSWIVARVETVAPDAGVVPGPVAPRRVARSTSARSSCGTESTSSNDSGVGNGNGSASVTCITSGRQAIWGHTSPPRSSVADEGRHPASGPEEAGQERGPRDRPAGVLGELGELVEEEARPHGGLHDAPPGVPEGPGQRLDLVVRRRAGSGPACRRRRLWVGACEVEKPMAPAAMASSTMARISATSSSVASRSLASSPST